MDNSYDQYGQYIPQREQERRWENEANTAKEQLIKDRDAYISNAIPRTRGEFTGSGANFFWAAVLTILAEIVLVLIVVSTSWLQWILTPFYFLIYQYHFQGMLEFGIFLLIMPVYFSAKVVEPDTEFLVILTAAFTFGLEVFIVPVIFQVFGQDFFMKQGLIGKIVIGILLCIPPIITASIMSGRKFSLRKQKHVDSKAIEIHYEKGHELIRQRRYREVIEESNKALAIDPNSDEALGLKGLALCELKQYEKAIKYLDKALAINPNNASAHCNRGFSLLHLRKFEEAIEACNKTLAIYPNASEAHNNKGLALYGLKLYEEAVAEYEKALIINPQYTVARNNKNNAQNKVNKRKSIKKFKSFLKIK